MVMFYFSATGNSKYIAELFCRNMEAVSNSAVSNFAVSDSAVCHSVEEEIDFSQLIKSSEIICFCYPIFGSRVPRLMREFAAKYMELFKNKKLIIFCTQMGGSGDGARAFTDVFPCGFVEVIYAEHFLMPNNVCNLFFLPLATNKIIQWYLAKAKKKMEIVCNDIKNGIVKKRGFNPFSQGLGLFQGSFMPGIEKRAKSKVWIDGDCNQCGLCVSICPMNNFGLEDNRIITKNNCMICYRCINKCPKKAISVFLRGKVKKQYGYWNTEGLDSPSILP